MGLLPYPFLLRRVIKLPEDANRSEINQIKMLWCTWLTFVAFIWFCGNWALAPQTNYSAEFVITQQAFVYLTFLWMVVAALCLSSSWAALCSVIVIGNLIPFEFIVRTLTVSNKSLSLLNAHIYFSGQLLIYLIAGGFFFLIQKQSYVREVALNIERSRSELERERANRNVRARTTLL